MTAEHQRMEVNAIKKIPLEHWGPYLSERQWGTVREDYSEHSDAWNYFPFDHAHCRAYQWGEDGIAGISDYFQNLCFAVSMWNGKDSILKERLFGLGNNEGNHGEDVKELYYYLDNIPTHYYMQYLYKYPQQAFPYQHLRDENKRLSKLDPEYEILDTGVFDNDQYFDVDVTYAKQNAEDIFIRIKITNKYTHPAPVTILPSLWFYNRKSNKDLPREPVITLRDKTSVKASHSRLGNYFLYYQKPDYTMFTDNVTNFEKVNGTPNESIFTKDAFHGAIIRGENLAELKAQKSGTKFSPVYTMRIEGGKSACIYLRLCNKPMTDAFQVGFENIFKTRKAEADSFYESILPTAPESELYNIQRQALSGLLWSKQYYHYDVENWLSGTDGIAVSNQARQHGRNHDWKHLKNQDIILMPDKWEYPWYAAWDLAFHCIPMAMLDPSFAKHQLLLIMREWYMKPDGQLPAYEWHFSDVNPPVHAWSALQVYRVEKSRKGVGDINFLKKIFHKLHVVD
jgi:hypothetical protein